MFNKKKKYFGAMITDAEKVIWDLEFKKYTALRERENTRRQYDQVQDALSRVNAQLLNDKLEQTSREKLENEKKGLEKTLNDLKTHIANIDGVVHGAAPSQALPDGAEGIDNKLSSWVQRREYIKGFIKHNC